MSRRSIDSERELQAEEDFTGTTPFDRITPDAERESSFEELKSRYKELGEVVGPPPDLFDPDDLD